MTDQQNYDVICRRRGERLRGALWACDLVQAAKRATVLGEPLEVSEVDEWVGNDYALFPPEFVGEGDEVSEPARLDKTESGPVLVRWRARCSDLDGFIIGETEVLADEMRTAIKKAKAQWRRLATEDPTWTYQAEPIG